MKQITQFFLEDESPTLNEISVIKLLFIVTLIKSIEIIYFH